MLSEVKSRILSSLEGGGFQDLCDSLLYAKGYKEIFQLGMKAGTSKTTKGNPDTYFIGESGKYIFVAYTTEQKNIDQKIRADIEKCLDKDKTGVEVKDIEKIICCHTSSTLKAGDDQALRRLCASHGVELELYGIDKIANEIYKNYPYLAKDKLNLSIDSNQIFPAEEFVRRYDAANRMNAPLATLFLHRDKEKKKVLEALEEKGVVIILGKAGVGKSRLALEAAKEYKERHKCELLCIKCNHLSIMEDLYRHIPRAGKYLILIDDANELSGLQFLLEYITMADQSYDVRIVATVRDYASKSVIDTIKNVTEPECVLVSKFTNLEIQEFLSLNLKIENVVYINQIVRISDGNPRIAYMAGKLAIEQNDLRSIMNMDSLYERYYSYFLDKTTILSDQRLCLTAGIISLFRTINLENLNRIQDIFALIEMDENEFMKNIHSLHDMEFVEIKLNKVARISDQCLSNYMLYYTLFVKRLIRFSDILRVGFRQFQNSTVRSVNMLLQIFYSDEMKDYLTEQVSIVWEEFKADERLFYEFVKIFSAFKLEESLLYINEKIEQAEEIEIDVDLLEQEESKWSVNLKDSILQLLIGYRSTNYLSDAIELMIKYCIKKQDIVKEVYSLLETNYSFDTSSHRENYYTQKIVIDKIRENLEYPVIKKLFYQVSRIYLSLSYTSVESEDGRSFTPYWNEIKLSEGSKKYRSNIWNEIISLAKNVENVEDTIQLLLSYPNDYGRQSYYVEEMKYDWQFILLVLEELRTHIEPFRFAYICSRLSRVARICSFKLTKKYKEEFAIDEWKLYKVLSSQFYRDAKDSDEWEARFETNIKKHFENCSANQLDNIVKNISHIIKIIGKREADIKHGISCLCTLLADDRERLWAFTLAYFKYGEDIELRPYMIVGALLKQFDNEKELDSVWDANFPQKEQWQYAYFELVDDNLITQDDFRRLMDLIENTVPKSEGVAFEINLRILDKFKKYSPDIYFEVTRKIIEKAAGDTNIISMFFSSLFNRPHYSPEEILNIYEGKEDDLKYIYFKCLEKHGFIDYKGDFLNAFITDDMDWIRCYAQYIKGKFGKNEISQEEHRMDNCWKQEDYLAIFDIYYDELLCKEPVYWYDLRHFRNVLSPSKEKEINNRKEQWIFHYIEEKHSSENIIELFNVLQEMGAEIRKKAILCFLKYNSDFALFKRLSLESNSWSGSTSITNKIIFYEELLSEIQGIKFLEHKRLIREKIDMWKETRKRQELEEILLDLYR